MIKTPRIYSWSFLRDGQKTNVQCEALISAFDEREITSASFKIGVLDSVISPIYKINEKTGEISLTTK